VQRARIGRELISKDLCGARQKGITNQQTISKTCTVGCRHLLLASDVMHGQLGVMDPARLDVVRARNDSEQAGIGWCLVMGILDQHSHFATTRFRPAATVNISISPGGLGDP
jgi:hypothetical protein